MANKKRHRQNFFYRINWQIRAPEVRLIDDNKKQIAVLKIEEARKLAGEEGLDLVEVASKANPPVVQLIDYSKFKYREEKKRREERKKQKEEIKEFQLKPFIAKEDLENRISRIKKFLEAGTRIKIIIRFFGRQIEKTSFGYELLENIKSQISEFGTLEGEAKIIGKRLIAFIVPVRDGQEKKKNQKENQESNS